MYCDVNFNAHFILQQPFSKYKDHIVRTSVAQGTNFVTKGGCYFSCFGKLSKALAFPSVWHSVLYRCQPHTLQSSQEVNVNCHPQEMVGEFYLK